MMNEIIIPLTPKKPWNGNQFVSNHYSHERWQLCLEKWSITIYRANFSREHKRWDLASPYGGIWWDWEYWQDKKKLIQYDNIWYDGNHYALRFGPICFSWGD